MKQKHTKNSAHTNLVAALALAFVTLVSIVALEESKGHAAWWSPQREISSGSTNDRQQLSPVQKGGTQTGKTEKRLYLRLQNLYGAAGTVQTPRDLASALDERRELLKSRVAIRVMNQTGEELSLQEIAINADPTLLKLNTSGKNAQTILDEEALRDRIVAMTIDHLVPPEHCVITSIVPAALNEDGEPMGYQKAETSGCAVKDSITFDVPSVTKAVASAIRNGTGSVVIPLKRVEGKLFNMSKVDLGELTLLATGKTNFKGSPWNRNQNIHKALEQHLTNNIVLPGDTFSFNSTLGGSVTQSRGWHMALGIFGGGALILTPGGGICQTSTTMYRAALNAGFPIVEQSNHSLFVTYYEKYAVGQDATIFPGHKDLQFINDTKKPIVIQAYVDGDDAYINIFGTPDGRTVTMEGPYFSGDAPEYVRYKDKPLRSSEIGWVRRVTKSSGMTAQEVFVSRYRDPVGNWVRKRWARDEIVAEVLKTNF